MKFYVINGLGFAKDPCQFRVERALDCPTTHSSNTAGLICLHHHIAVVEDAILIVLLTILFPRFPILAVLTVLCVLVLVLLFGPAAEWNNKSD